jgi:hypothetical protein
MGNPNFFSRGKTKHVYFEGVNVYLFFYLYTLLKIRMGMKFYYLLCGDSVSEYFIYYYT